ncbi:ABC transporter substrate-binding protein [Campylobacter upsaliensis]|uniref:ABC transporter substrate-binding protein n=1 Tax=Campylobacter upsaliensis TaxID=28080 RepID=UPI0022EA49C7|nr:ABC transporter substrate-binding protein [Campylobacter upsaliensis]MEB2787630.1 ABC transporter substrate-binding protein [Campylobacter upsaliensis]MEB2796692.1 ABC transporter substrate-binding protein [Campylobacter upsaliensis]HEC1548631.1 ABC transporter substrate-binding protein [Campylobacter upsaliensis]HEC1553741.1 ABC transporter substrate-binding protein [Campylobacter upsaliensis]HEC1564143.1 ABC transporter substrate-binding protein [Campylobacter upsaliensis]
MKKFLLILVLLFAISNAKERLVVLDPASVETLFMLGAEEQIVGIANLQHSNIYPSDKSSKLTSVGTFSNPSLEKIISLKPSLVILSSYSLNLEEGLKNFGVKSIYLKANHFDDIKKNIQILAQITHKNEEGKRLISEFERGLESLKNDPLNQSAIYLYSNNPLMAFNDNSLMAEILTLIGITNLSPKSQIERPIISAEFILKQNPDLLILGINASQAFLTQNALLSQTKAVKTGQIYTNEKTHILLRLSPKIIERIAEFKRALKSFKDS